MGAQHWVIVIWFAVNLLLNVALVGRDHRFTVAGAVVALFAYPSLVWLLIAGTP